MSLKKEQQEKDISYPRNLLKALKYDIEAPTEDQILGLEFILGQLKEYHREVIELHYKNGLTYRKISEQIGKSSARCSQIGITAIRRLQKIDWMVWVEDGYQGHLNKQKKLAEEIQKKFIAEGKMQQADLIFQSPNALPGISANYAKLLTNAGIYNIGILRETLKKDLWTNTIPGIGDKTGSKIVYAMYNAEIIDDSFEAYKEVSERKYCFAKYARLREENSSMNN